MSALKTKIMMLIICSIFIMSIAGIAHGLRNEGSGSTSVVKSNAAVTVSEITTEQTEATATITPSVDLDVVIQTAALTEEKLTTSGTATVAVTSVYVKYDACEDSAILVIGYNGDSYGWYPELSDNDWVAVEYNGEIGYIESEYVTVEGGTDKSSAVFVASSVSTGVIADSDEESITDVITPIPTATSTPTYLKLSSFLTAPFKWFYIYLCVRLLLLYHNM